MSVFVGTYFDSFVEILQKNHPNTYWSMFRLENRLGVLVRLGFKVGDNMTMYQIEIDEHHIKERPDYIYPAVSKLLNMKETTRICVKFWTGVEIV